MLKNTMLKNIFILCLSGILAKSFDFIFRAYYSRALGPEGMGLLSLGFSVHGVMLTFATAGLGVAVSKVTSEYMELKKTALVFDCMRCALCGVTALSLTVILLVFVFSPIIAQKALGDARVTASLCTLAPSVLFMGISYCLKGFFYASRKTLPPASSEILEQAVKFVSIGTLLKYFLPYGIEYGCAAVFGGISIGEFSSCLYLSVLYLRDKRGMEHTATGERVSSRQILFRLLGVSIPSMITSLCGSVLRMQEEVLIISALERGDMSHSEAVSSLGIIHGMAMPLLVLPLTLMGSVTSLLIPEISRADVRGRRRLKAVAKKIYACGIPTGVAVGIIFFVFGDKITSLVYGSNTAARLVSLLAPLCPVMFIDSLSCAVLNGLGKQVRMLAFSVSDFALRFSLIYLTLPSGKMTAFAFMIAASNIFTCVLSAGSVLSALRQSDFFISQRIKLTNRLKYGIVRIGKFSR